MRIFLNDIVIESNRRMRAVFWFSRRNKFIFLFILIRIIIGKNFTYWCYSIRKIIYENKKEVLILTFVVNQSLISNAVCISCIIESSWAIHESPGRKPDREEAKSLLLWKWLNRKLLIILSNILLKMGSKLIGR